MLGTINPQNRRLAAYLYVQDALSGAEVLELGAGGDDSARFLLEQGARKVVQVVAKADGAALANREQVTASSALTAQFDVVLLFDVAPAALRAQVTEAHRLMKPEGLLVVAARSRDVPGVTADEGVAYYDFVDTLQAVAGPTKLVGQAPFFGVTLIEYGIKDIEPVLDGRLAGSGERVQWYIGLCGERRNSIGGYGVVQLQAASAPADPTTRDLIAKHAQEVADLSRKVNEAQKQREEHLRDIEARKATADALTKARATIGQLEAKERDARKQLAEAEGKIVRLTNELQSAAASPSAPSASAPHPVAAAPSALLGALAGTFAAPPMPAAAVAAPPVAVAAPRDESEELRALRAENEKLKIKEAEARNESWQHMKARSEAEAQAAEVREDTVRKLKDARKIASVELMRALEEATKKAVGLRDELTRTERERKEVVVQKDALEAELAAQKQALETALATHKQALEAELATQKQAFEAELATHKQAFEAELANARAHAQSAATDERLVQSDARRRDADARRAQAEELLKHTQAELQTLNDRARKPSSVGGEALLEGELERVRTRLAEVEEEAIERAESALRARQQLRDRERENEALRRELRDRDARIVAYENHDPPGTELLRLEAELKAARAELARVEALQLDKDGQLERHKASLQHERMRAERLVAENKQLRDKLIAIKWSEHDSGSTNGPS